MKYTIVKISGEDMEYALNGSKGKLVETTLESSLTDPQVELLLAFVTFFNATKT